MSQRLLPELIDPVLEHLTDDKSTLAACSLVCKAWIHPSRRRLFASVDLETVNATELMELMQLSHIPRSQWPVLPYIRRVRFVGRFATDLWDQTIARLRTLENLQSFALTDLPWYLQEQTSLGAAFDNFDTIVRLHLDRAMVISFFKLAEMICAFPRLNTLIIARSRSEWSTHSFPTIPPPQSLRALEMRDCDWPAVLLWLMSYDRIPSLHTLLLRGNENCQGDTSTLSRFVQALGSNLKEFWLDPGLEESDVFITLIDNPRLRSLTVQFRGEPQDSQYFSQFLAEIASCEVEEIVIGLVLAYDELDEVEWNEVDEILALPRFSKLRSFCIRTNICESGWVADYLPRSYARGIVSVQPLRTLRRESAIL